ncbi:MAG: Rne/Rng family ribonuclease [Synechococcales bacterium]|nr:Rne/Rng family ribonuclease [Synechococcales bacterium]
MSKQIIIAEQHRIAAVFSEEQIQELIVATGTHQVGDIYLGIVENVLPGIDAAFVNIGDTDRNGFIHVSDLGPLRLKRTAGSITELLAPQQKVLVQVMKEPTGSKGPRLTGNVSLPGRYLVLTPYGRGVNLSRRITNENERNRLRALAILIKPAGMGLVVRTEAEGMPEEAIIEDLEHLQKHWENTLQEAASNRPPMLLTRDDDFIQRVLRDVYSSDVNRIVVDSPTGLKRVKQHLMSWGGGRMPQGIFIDQHKERSSILEFFRVNAAIREALKPRVDLPSGGYIIIEKTEALTVIDVNSGSFTRSATARETVLWTNCEAATEIARQLRLRNIAGVIVVDFIDMESRRDQLQVLEHFNQAMRLDKAKPQIAQLTELGLVELTRKRQGKNIYELFGQTCHTCGGLGLTVQLPGEAPSAVVPTIPTTAEPTASRRSEARPEPRTEARREPVPSYEPFRNPSFDELEGDSSESDLELLHHPSYQERGGGRDRGNRRRRRRAGESPYIKEPLTKESFSKEPSLTKEPFSKEPFSKEPLSKEPFSKEPTSREPSPKTAGWEESGRYATPVSNLTAGNGKTLVAVEETSLPPRERESRESREGRESRESRYEERRSRGRRERTASEPLESVYVEMTPEEQEVYAWMGLSPLLLSTQEVKNPRSAQIAVVLPGETPETNQFPLEEETVVAVVSIPASDPEDLEPASMFEEAELEEAEFTDSEPIRRRRRRSSATD